MLIQPIAMAQVTPVARALPTLQVTTIAEDDQWRDTGVIVFGLVPLPGWPSDKPTDPYCMANPGACIKKEAQYKIMVTFNGVPVDFTVAGAGFSCEFVKKEWLHPLQKAQFSQEVIATALTDESANFVCKFRPGKPGVGVLDVYYVGPQQKQYIADYIMVVSVWETFGRTTVYGVDMQDICVLGWANSNNTMYLTKPDGTLAFAWPDPIGPWVSCEDAANLQRANLGLPLLYS
jgi:hypothetical protein